LVAKTYTTKKDRIRLEGLKIFGNIKDVCRLLDSSFLWCVYATHHYVC